MIKFLITLVIFLSFSFSAFSQEREIVEYNGKIGYWFSEEVGDKILNDLEKFKLTNDLVLNLELKIDKQEKKISLLEYEIVLDEDLIKKHKEIITEQDIKIEKVVKENQKLREESGKWYNNKALWFVGGFVISSILCVSVSFSLGG
jgi:hypothetical protein